MKTFYEADIRRRVKVLTFVLAGWGAIVASRLVQVQVFGHSRAKAAVLSQAQDVVKVESRRGDILDRNGEILACSLPSPSVVIRPVDKETAADQRGKLQTLKKELGLSETEVAYVLGRLREGRGYTYVKKKILEADAARVMALKLPGIALEPGTRRSYPHGALAAHILGGVSLDGSNRAGVESRYNDILKGEEGEQISFRIAGGGNYQTQVLKSPVPGRDLVLTIDATMQYIAEKELDKAVAEHKAASGTVIVMDPPTGEILALASWPAYDVNEFPGPKEAWMNRAVQAAYEPGSTFKIVTAAAARERDRVNYSEVFDCSAGSIRIGGTTITDHERVGVLSFPDVIIHSSNVGTVQFAQRLSIAEYHETIKAFEFGTRTGIDLPREASGKVHPPEEWNKKNSLPHVAIGYEVMVTAIQTLRAMNVFATGGLLVRPHVVKTRRTGPRGRRRSVPGHQREDRARARRPRFFQGRRGRDGQALQPGRLRRRGQDRNGPKMGSDPESLHAQVHGFVRRLHATQTAAPVDDRRPRRAQRRLLRRPKLRARVQGHRPPGPALPPRPAGTPSAAEGPDGRAEERETAMKLQEVLAGIRADAGHGAEGVDISGIAYNSNAVKPGFLFAALPGAARNGMDFVAEAVGNGAVAVLSAWPKPPAVDTAWIQASEAREALALAAANFYAHPSDRMKVVGVTGTKGKTTTTFVLDEILRAAGAKTGLIGTIEYRRPGWRKDAPRTTPESSDLQALLRDFLDAGVSHCVMEVSSHALEQKRVWGVSYDVSVFTNLSGEHLDYHPTMEAYFEAKKKLFFLNHKKSTAVVNWDDPWGQKLVAELPMTTVTFGLEPAAIVRALKYAPSEAGIDTQVTYPGA